MQVKIVELHIIVGDLGALGPRKDDSELSLLQLCNERDLDVGKLTLVVEELPLTWVEDTSIFGDRSKVSAKFWNHLGFIVWNFNDVLLFFHFVVLSTSGVSQAEGVRVKIIIHPLVRYSMQAEVKAAICALTSCLSENVGAKVYKLGLAI